MIAEVLLSCESLATCGAGKWPLPSVATDVPLHNRLLLGSVSAEWALVEFHWHHQSTTSRGRNRPHEWNSMEKSSALTFNLRINASHIMARLTRSIKELR